MFLIIKDSDTVFSIYLWGYFLLTSQSQPDDQALMTVQGELAVGA